MNVVVFKQLNELCVFGKEPVTWMDGLSSSSLGNVEEMICLKVGEARLRRTDEVGLVHHLGVLRVFVGFTVDSDGLYAEFAGSLSDSASNFASVCNKYFLEHHFVINIIIVG